MNAHKMARLGWTMVLLIGAAFGLAPAGYAQTLGEQSAAMDMNDNLNAGSTGPGGAGYIGLNRARGVAGTQPQGAEFNPNAPGVGTPGQPGQPGAAAEATKITVITGTRVRDAVTGELLDDPVKKKVPVSEKSKYHDDGLNGDMVANDQEYTKIDERNDMIGHSNQRVKEQLVQALLVAESYNPLEFYGYNLMSTDRQEGQPRNRAWKIVPDPKGRGMMLAEVPVEKPLKVPKYRDKQTEEDIKVKDWSLRFLQEYRKNRDSMTSEFFPLYIPMPPQVPATIPPIGWTPFSDPDVLLKEKLARGVVNAVRGAAGGMGGNMGGGMPGGSMMGGRSGGSSGGGRSSGGSR